MLVRDSGVIFWFSQSENCCFCKCTESVLTSVGYIRLACRPFGVKQLPELLQWRHNERDAVSNHQPHDCLLNRLFRHRSKKISKLHVTGLCEGNSPVTGEFPHKGPVTRKMFSFDDATKPILIYWQVGHNNKFHSNFVRNSNISIEGNARRNVVCEMLVFSFRPY